MEKLKKLYNHKITPVIIFCFCILGITILPSLAIYDLHQSKYKTITDYTYENSTLSYSLEDNIQTSSYTLKLPKPIILKKEDTLQFAVSHPMFSNEVVIEFWINGKKLYGKGDNLSLELVATNKSGKDYAVYNFENKIDL